MKIEELSGSICYNPFSCKLYYHRGLEYYMQNKYKEAIADFEKAIDLNHEYVEAICDLGLVYAYGLKEYEKSLEYLYIAEGIKSDYSAIYILRSTINLILKRYDDAIIDSTKYIEINPGKAFSYMIRGYASIKGVEQYSDAIKDFTKAIEIDPKLIKAYISRGETYVNGFNNYEKALEDFKKVLGIDCNSAEAYFSIGLTYLKMQDIENTKTNWEKAYELGYKNVKLLLEALNKKIK